MTERVAHGDNSDDDAIMPTPTRQPPMAKARSIAAASQLTTPASGRRARYEQGIWAALLTLVLAFLLAGVAGAPSPLEPITELLVRYTPISLANMLLNVLGDYARALALLGAAALTMPIGGLIALIAPASNPPHEPLQSDNASNSSHRSRLPWMDSRELLRWALTAAVALLATLPLALLAAYPAETASALLAGIAYAPMLWLVRRWGKWRAVSQTGGAATDHPLARRAFVGGLVTNGTRAALLLALGSFDRWSDALGTLLERGERLRTLFRFVAPPPRMAGFPVAGEEPEVTPVERFYVISKNDVDPRIMPEEWSLRIGGAVHSSLTLTYDELLALPRLDQYVTLRCVSNTVDGHFMSTAYWSGVSLESLLRRAGIAHGAVAVQLHAPDAYAEVIPLEAALAPDALLAYAMNGQTLARRHGGPVRALLPGLYGFKNVKWVERVTVLPEVAKGFWEASGWTAASVHSVARIDVWRRRSASASATPSAGVPIVAAGVAFAGARGVAAVQVRVDGGAWRETTVHAPALSPLTWVQWRVELTLTPGKHTLTARLIDGDGQPQDATTAAIYPDGARGLHSIHIVV